MCARQKTTQRCRELLADERICINAQDCYKKAKWKAKTVRPSGTTAKVISSAGAPVTFSGIGGSDPDALSEGDEFWVEETGWTGTYTLKLEHNDYNSCTDTNSSGKVFRFEFDWELTNISGGTAGTEATVNLSTGQVDAPKTVPPEDNTSGAQSYQYYDLWIQTWPVGQYEGNVEARAKLRCDTDGSMAIRVCPEPLNPMAVAVTANFALGFINVTCATESGSSSYGTCIAGADLQVYIDTNAAASSFGNVKRGWSHAEPGMQHKTESFESAPNMTLTEYSQLVTWNVGTPTVHEFWVRMGVASNAEKFCAEDCPASKVVTNRQKLSLLDVSEEDAGWGVFDIVP